MITTQYCKVVLVQNRKDDVKKFVADLILASSENELSTRQVSGHLTKGVMSGDNPSITRGSYYRVDGEFFSAGQLITDKDEQPVFVLDKQGKPTAEQRVSRSNGFRIISSDEITKEEFFELKELLS